MNDKEFYDTCSELLGIAHEYKAPFKKRTRWNTRKLGNGRYEGFGLIRRYGSGALMISRNHGTKMFDNHDDVFSFLKSIRTH